MTANRMTGRSLTRGERMLAGSMFGDAIDYDSVRVHHRKWWPFQPRGVTMAPDGDIWFHPESRVYCSDFCDHGMSEQGLFIHEMTHVWQAQTRGRWYLPLMRHPWCSYNYVLEPGKAFARYGIEQQAEIVRHGWMARRGWAVPDKPGRAAFDAVLPFGVR